MRINKMLSNLGYCSRKDTKKLIEENRITVNGKPCIQGQWVEYTDEILLDGNPLTAQELIYIILNKPPGITCTADLEVQDNIISFINYDKYIFPVGRLDKDSQGLILLTNDGELANKILESENRHEKEYLVFLDRAYDDVFLTKMMSGVEILGKVTRPCKVSSVDNLCFKIVLTQGLNRQIRRMCSSLGYKVQKLERVRILTLLSTNLRTGQWRHLEEYEIQHLRNSI